MIRSFGGTELPMSKEQAVREGQRNRAMYNSGYKFISLVLNDIRRRIISGVEVLNAQQYVNEQRGGIVDYHYEVMGGAIKFVNNEMRGCFTFDLLDTEHNRQFLASMWDRDFWVIEDENVKKDIEDRAKKITESLITKKQEEPVQESQPTSVPETVVNDGHIKEVRPEQVKKVAGKTTTVTKIDNKLVFVNDVLKPESAATPPVDLPDVGNTSQIDGGGLVTTGARVRQV